MPSLSQIASRLRVRLGQDDGFTLIELMVACLVGTVVIIAASSLIDASGRASVTVLDRVDAVQRGRVAMEQVTQRLRSQVCPSDSVPPVLYGDATQVTFYADLSNRTDGLFQPEVRRLRFNASEGRLYEDVWEYQTTAPTATAPGGPTVPSYAAALQTANLPPTPPPTSTRRILDDVRQTKNATGVVQPVFTYFGFDTASPPAAELPLGASGAQLSADDRDRVVRVGVAFDAQPARKAGGTAARSAIDTRFENSVFVRTADPLLPTRDLAACV